MLVTLINKQAKVKLPSIKEDVPWLLNDEDDKYNASILFDISKAEEWVDAVSECDYITDLYITADKDKDYKKLKNSILERLGPIDENMPISFPMSEGFKANANFFKLGFLDKTSVTLGRQFKELLPVLWMKAGARGACPQLESEELPKMLICQKNHFAVLIDEDAYPRFEKTINEIEGIDVVYIITDSENGYREMAHGLNVEMTFHLYRDYLDNFRINNVR